MADFLEDFGTVMHLSGHANQFELAMNEQTGYLTAELAVLFAEVVAQLLSEC